jgi:hypothetical protein
MEIIENIEKERNLSLIKYLQRGESVYSEGRQVLVRACHDAFIEYPNEKGERGIILVKRKSEPAKNLLWCLGGGIEKGVLIGESLYKNILRESGLEIFNPVLINVERCIWNSTPNENYHKKNLPAGTDDLILVYYCEGKGNLNLDKMHDSPSIITPKEYTPEFRKKLHPYVQRGMDLSFSLMFNKQDL